MYWFYVVVLIGGRQLDGWQLGVWQQDSKQDLIKNYQLNLQNRLQKLQKNEIFKVVMVRNKWRCLVSSPDY